MMFDLKKNAVKSRMISQQVIPLSGTTASPQDILQFSLPCGRYGQYLDVSTPYLSFRFTNKDATNAITLDHSAYSLFDRVVVKSSGGVVSDLQYFPVYAAAMLDQNVNTQKNTMSIFMGTAFDADKNIVRAGQSVAASASVNIALPLLGTPLDASSCDKHVPIGALSDLTLELYLAGNNDPIVSAAAGNWALSEIQLNIGIVELDAGAQRKLDQMYGGAMKWSATLWRGFNASVPGTTTQDQIVVPVKCSSAKTIQQIYRPSANIGDRTKLTNSARINPFAGGGQYQVSIGSDNFPAVPVRKPSEFLVELLKSWHALGNAQMLASSFNNTTWNRTTDSTDAALAGTFIASLDLDSFSGASGVVHSGQPVIGSTSMITNAQYTSAIGFACIVTTFVNYDAILSVNNAQLEVDY